MHTYGLAPRVCPNSHPASGPHPHPHGWDSGAGLGLLPEYLPNELLVGRGICFLLGRHRRGTPTLWTRAASVAAICQGLQDQRLSARARTAGAARALGKGGHGNQEAAVPALEKQARSGARKTRLRVERLIQTCQDPQMCGLTDGSRLPRCRGRFQSLGHRLGRGFGSLRQRGEMRLFLLRRSARRMVCR